MPIRSLRLVGGGAYIDVENRSSTDSIANGSQGDKTPEWSFNGFTRYDIAEGAFKGLGASLGMIYQGDRLSALKTTAATDPLVMPWFTRVDAGLYFRVNNSLDFALNVENLANDERIVYGGDHRIDHRTGLAPPRHVPHQLPDVGDSPLNEAAQSPFLDPFRRRPVRRRRHSIHGRYRHGHLLRAAVVRLVRARHADRGRSGSGKPPRPPVCPWIPWPPRPRRCFPRDVSPTLP